MKLYPTWVWSISLTKTEAVVYLKKKMCKTCAFILTLSTQFIFRGEEFYPSVDNVNYGGQGKVSEAAVDRMVADLEKQYVN